MKKLKSLLKQLGGSDELVDSICEEFNLQSTKLRDHFEKQFEKKVARAKKICAEELDKEKQNLARKVAVYLESKAEAINQAINKQRAIEESEAASLLRRTKAILEDIPVNDDGANRRLLAAEKKIDRLEKQNGALKEERDAAVAKANKANDIAHKAIKHSNLLESKIKTFKKRVIAPKPKAKPLPKKSAKKKAASPKRIDESRIVAAKAKTTRPISESQQKPAAKERKALTTIESIASQIDD